MASYPKRSSHFAHRAVRAMAKACVCQEHGIDVFALVTIVAHTEDAKRYTGAVTYHNNQLQDLLGFRKWDRLDKARRAAVEAGWLHYESPASGKRTAGFYWTLIPAGFGRLNDSPMDEGAYPLEGYAIGYRDGMADGKAYPSKGDAQGDAQGEPSTLTLNPIPNPKEKAASPLVFPPELDTPAVRESLDAWRSYKHAAKHAYRVPAKSLPTLLKHWTQFGADAFCQAVEISIGNEWRGLQDPKPGSGNGQPAPPESAIDKAFEALDRRKQNDQ